MRSRFAQGLFITHRYLGIVVGLVMLIWCLSGFVMMYVPYPRLTERERLAHLAPISWNECCSLPDTGEGGFKSLQAEMLGGRLVARVTNARGATGVVSLSSGAVIASVSAGEGAEVARQFASSGSAATPRFNVAAPRLVSRLNYDQWTVQGAHGGNRPLLQFDLQDPAGTELYVSAVTGRAIQRTTAHERFWNWLGSVPHWIYFTSLRQDGRLWTQVVVWSSVTGCFLTLTGIYIGIRQLQTRKGGRIPYRGLHYYHHLLGLFFGLFVLTWVASGLVSMNPWGFLEGGGFDEPQRLQGAAHSPSEFAAALGALARSPNRFGIVSVESVPLDGRLYLAGTRVDGSRFRVDSQSEPAALSSTDLRYMGATLDSTRDGYQMERITAADAYYFSHHRELVEFPAYRVILNDAGKTRYYLDPMSGQIRAKIDREGQWYRWLHQAPHRMDFTAVLRSHPLWDVLTLFLLTGTTLVCMFGVYIGCRGLMRG
jgi:hypothetical protein